MTLLNIATGKMRRVAEHRFLGNKVHWTGGEGIVRAVRIADIESGIADAGTHVVADVEVFPTFLRSGPVRHPNKVIPVDQLHLTPECRPARLVAEAPDPDIARANLWATTPPGVSPGIEPLFGQRFYQRHASRYEGVLPFLSSGMDAVAKTVKQGGHRDMAGGDLSHLGGGIGVGLKPEHLRPSSPVTLDEAWAALGDLSARASGRKRSDTPVSIQTLDEHVQALIDKMKALNKGGPIIDMSLLRPEGNPIIELARKVREGKDAMTQPNEPLFEFPKPAWSASHSVVVPYKSSMGPIHRDQLWGWEEAPKHGIAVSGKTLKVTSNNIVEREVKESTAAFASVTTYRDVVSTTTHYPPEYADELRAALVGRCVIVDDYSDQARVARVTGILTREQSYDGLGVCFTSVVDAGSGGVRPLSEVRPATRKELTDWATRLTIVLSGVACEFTWGGETLTGKIASVSYDVVDDAFYVYTYSHDGRIPATTVTIPYHERNEPLDLQEGETTAPADAINDRPTIEIDEPSAAERLFGSEPQPEDDGPVPPEAGNTTAGEDLPLLTPVLTLETGLLSAPFQDTVINDSYQKALASGRYDHLLIVRDREIETPMIRVMGTLKTADPIVMKIEIDTDAVHEALAELREDFAAAREVLRPRGVVGETEVRDGDEFTELTTDAAKDLLDAMASGASLGGYNATDLAETREAVESLPEDGVVTFGAHNLPVDVALEIADAWAESNPEIAKFMRERHVNNPEATGITMAIEAIPRDEFLLALAVLEKHIGAEKPQMVDDTDDKRLHGVQSIFAAGFLALLAELDAYGPTSIEAIREGIGAVPIKGLRFFLDDLVTQGLATHDEDDQFALTPRGSIISALSDLEASLPQRAGFNVGEIAAQAALLPAQVEKNLAKVIEMGTVAVASIDPDREYKLCL